MSSEEMNFDFNPITHNSPISANTKVVSNPGTPSNTSNTKIDNLDQQAKENARYDTISSETDVKPMYGGNINIYNLLYKKKSYIIHAETIEKSIKIFFKNKHISQDELIEIYKTNNITYSKKKEQKETTNIKSTYLVRNLNNNKIKVLKIH